MLISKKLVIFSFIGIFLGLLIVSGLSYYIYNDQLKKESIGKSHNKNIVLHNPIIEDFERISQEFKDIDSQADLKFNSNDPDFKVKVDKLKVSSDAILLQTNKLDDLKNRINSNLEEIDFGDNEDAKLLGEVTKESLEAYKASSEFLAIYLKFYSCQLTKLAEEKELQFSFEQVLVNARNAPTSEEFIQKLRDTKVEIQKFIDFYSSYTQCVMNEQLSLVDQNYQKNADTLSQAFSEYDIVIDKLIEGSANSDKDVLSSAGEELSLVDDKVSISSEELLKSLSNTIQNYVNQAQKLDLVAVEANQKFLKKSEDIRSKYGN